LGVVAMDEATKKKVEAAVLEILRGSDMESVTEYKVRKAAADRLGIDLSIPDRKLFVRGVVEEYLRSLSSQEEEGKGGGKREYDDQGDLILCRVSSFSRTSHLALVRSIQITRVLGFVA